MEYETKDFYISSVLQAAGLTIKKLKRQRRNLVKFVFAESPDEANALINKYWQGSLDVDAKTLIQSIRELKTRLHSKL